MERVTRDALRAMGMGETRTFDLPNAKACDNGKSVAYQLQNQLQCRFTVSTDYVNNRLSITKNPAL